MITTKNIAIVRGQTLPLLFTCKDYLGRLLDLTGATAYLTVRPSTLSTVNSFTHDSAGVGGIVIADQTGANKGQFTATISNTDTAPLEIGDYVWDAWIITAGGLKYPVVSTSIFSIVHEVRIP